jgi:signal transduction histidine kinase/CheY-like chemotaxis protein
VVGDAGGNVKVVGIIQDITARKRAEERLRRHHIFFEQMFAQSSVSTQILDKEGWCERINPKLSEIFGVEPEHMEGRVYNIFRDEAVRQGGIIPHLEKVFREGKAAEWEINFDIGVAAESQGIEVKEKKKAWYYNWAYPIFDADGALSHVIIQHTDITERKRREDERERLQGQVHQAQKMESVGRLAGGVAHDFNNMLSVILARSEFALEALDPADALYDDLKEIQQAGQRSADLTRQLLAFARMQAAVPRVLDLNDATDRMLNMLRTLLGENVSLLWRPGDDLWLVRVDGSQIDQILANLCVNARDAIADVGTVTVETANVTFDESSCAGHPERRVGEFVLLAITDDGHGMGEEVREHIFEPFFTTKQLGQGTGLGLATVYGIVQQNGGFISVRSEVGEGATLSVHLPRYYGQAQDDVPSFAEDRPRSRGETVLLVEDEAAILRLGRTMLERLGYEVLAAATPGEALRLAEQHAGRIDLLVTDVVMPEMNGRRLAERIGALVPDLKCLYMSGYTADVIADQGVLTEGIHFIQKPFTINGLAESVRTALGGRPGGGS